MNDMASTTLAQRYKASKKSLFVWTLGWLLSLALFAFGPKFIWDFNVTISLCIIAVNVVFGYLMIIANKKYLDGLDELQRQLHLNAMAISLGVSMVFGAIYGLLEPARLLESTPSPSNILFLMGISYFISLVVNSRKYQ
ncbi:MULTISPECIES: hypothetical protein [unclassified Arsukibacterium]|uniref:hypothetical protein n=1 Tax=unclassified Arsukibacterium TaxID=2635278 RepID=UPI000C5BB2C6|nr:MULTISPECIES: hypothetical protein [unclassified Arsukibacterium]MAA94596.1 hypothetical protein [Rheinheimera sp.]MBM32821.1 hypothetical protein [Rheinheimera sp.]HAW93361.1 hypothetical protein [Candidatus Azambacteria bacterium]|tara:strand:- start:2264 stop:2680 length:417 start_codon:yes stop_codon:yes gene_type:complete